METRLGLFVKLRVYEKCTYYDLAQWTGLHPSHISNLVNGRVRRPRAATLEKLARGLAVDPEVLSRLVLEERAAKMTEASA